MTLSSKNHPTSSPDFHWILGSLMALILQQKGRSPPQNHHGVAFQGHHVGRSSWDKLWLRPGTVSWVPFSENTPLPLKTPNDLQSNPNNIQVLYQPVPYKQDFHPVLNKHKYPTLRCTPKRPVSPPLRCGWRHRLRTTRPKAPRPPTCWAKQRRGEVQMWCFWGCKGKQRVVFAVIVVAFGQKRLSNKCLFTFKYISHRNIDHWIIDF